MSKHAPLRLVLAAALSAAAFAAGAQPVDPAVAPVSDDAAEDARDDDRRVDRRCLRHTGSRILADRDPDTDAGTEAAGKDTRRRCAIGNGTVYTREDIDGTGQVTVEEALRVLDPRVF